MRRFIGILSGARMRQANVNEVADAFDYTAGGNLSSEPGWSVVTGDFRILSGGRVTSLGGTPTIAFIAYEPEGFTIANDHQVECVLGPQVSSTGGNAQGITCALQPDGNGYHVYSDPSQAYFGYNDGGNGTDWVAYSHGLSNLDGIQLRLTVTGLDASRRVTAEIDVGGGWITPPGWGNRDFGVGRRHNGGKAGIAGYSSTQQTTITSVTIRNL